MARGHIRARGTDGRTWVIVVDAPPAEDGKRRQKWITVHGTKREAERERTRILREMDTGTYAETGKQTVEQYLRHWLKNTAKLELAPQSYEVYEAGVGIWSEEVGAIRLERLSPARVQEAIRKMDDSGLAAATVRRNYAVLRRALKMAVRWGLLPRNPAENVVLPRQEKQCAQSLTPDQAMHLLAAAKDDHNGILVILSLGLGLRSGEIFALRWRDVDMGARVVTVSRSMQRNREIKEPKNGHERRVSIPEFVRIALVAHKERQNEIRAAVGDEWNPEGYLVCREDGAPMYIQTTNVMRRICKRAGIPRVRLHDLRHTHATLLIAGGADIKAVSEELGHSDVRITLQVYHHVLPRTQAALADRINKTLGG